MEVQRAPDSPASPRSPGSYFSLGSPRSEQSLLLSPRPGKPLPLALDYLHQLTSMMPSPPNTGQQALSISPLYNTVGWFVHISLLWYRVGLFVQPITTNRFRPVLL